MVESQVKAPGLESMSMANKAAAISSIAKGRDSEWLAIAGEG
jgi:hypothetical protein